jgi:pimeloyl-ACP methyl ester carboxylesterase
VPYTRHILYAACDKAEVAWESDEKCGVFTRALLEALEPFGGALDYGEAFTQACAAIRMITRNQNPQAEAIGGFNPRAGFLGKPVPPGRRKRYEVFTNPEKGDWRIRLGAAQGLASDMSEAIRLEVFSDPAQGDVLGTVTLTNIGVTESYLEPGATKLHPLKTYWAEPLTMPFAPFIVYCKEPETAKLVQKALDERNESAVLLSDKPEGCIIEIRNTDGNLTLHAPGKEPLVHGVMGTDEVALTYLLKVLDHLAHWSRVHKLDNPKTQLPREAVQLGMFLQKNGAWEALKGDKAILSFSGQRINFRVTVGNQSGQDLYLALVYLDPRFGMQVFWSSTGPVPSGTAGLQIFENFFALPPGADEELDTLKLVVSTDPIEQIAFSRKGLMPILVDPRNLGGYRSIGMLSEPDWFAHTLLVRILRDSAESTLGETPLSLAGGQVTIGQHPAFRSGVALPGPGSKGVDPIPLDHPHFQNNPFFKPLALASTRGEAAPFIDLTNIQNNAELAAQPLEITLKPEDDDSLILPFWFDGENFVPIGELTADAAGMLNVQISSIPEEAPQAATRSLGSAIRLFFFKFGKEYGLPLNTQNLCWVDYRPDGSCERRTDGLAAKVKAAEKILLLVHGIIGDTKDMAKAMYEPVGKNGALVLTFDYENLNTPIEQTALALKTKLLEDAGLGDKKITILAHSMGGLVSRHLIEKLGGHVFVDKLLMAGTPNGGSKFGSVPDYLNWAGTLMGLGMKYFSVALPALAGLIGALKYAKDNLFITLEQMKPGSDFLKALAATETAPVPYHVIAGDGGAFLAQGNDPGFMDKAMAQIGSWVYSGEPNDGAVSVASIASAPQATANHVAAHHCVYFTPDILALYEKTILSEN